MILTIYRSALGLSLTLRPGHIAVEAELLDGYRIWEDVGGEVMVLGNPGEFGMRIEDALEHRVLIVHDR